MRRVIGNLFKLLLVVSILFLLYLYLVFCMAAPRYDNAYNAAVLDKRERLLSIKREKIILVGNSNLAYGIDSKILEEEIGMPVVNMGLHGGLGNKMLEQMALSGIKKGDLVIVCHSTFADNNELDDPELAWITIENHRELWGLIDKNDMKKMFPALPSYCLKATYLWASGQKYSIDERRFFNEYGDYAIERNKNQGGFVEKISVPEINETCILRLNNLNKYCNEMGATMLIAGYPIYTKNDMPNREDIIIFEKELRSALDCDVISDYTDYMYSSDLFYNSVLHMTNEGAEKRTRQLVEDIKGYMVTGQ